MTLDPTLRRLTQGIDPATAPFVPGLYQEPTSDLPFFLAENHWKIFWSAHVSDKIFATFSSEDRQ